MNFEALKYYFNTIKNQISDQTSYLNNLFMNFQYIIAISIK